MVCAILKSKKTEVEQKREIVKSMYTLQKHVRSKQIVFAVSRSFKTDHRATNLPVLLAAWSAGLYRARQIGVLFGSADFPPRRVHLFPPRLLSKNEAEMCRREVGGGVNDLHCCATHSQGVLKPGNSWSQQSVHHFICGRQDEQLDRPNQRNHKGAVQHVFIPCVWFIQPTRKCKYASLVLGDVECW